MKKMLSTALCATALCFSLSSHAALIQVSATDTAPGSSSLSSISEDICRVRAKVLAGWQCLTGICETLPRLRDSRVSGAAISGTICQIHNASVVTP